MAQAIESAIESVQFLIDSEWNGTVDPEDDINVMSMGSFENLIEGLIGHFGGTIEEISCEDYRCGHAIIFTNDLYILVLYNQRNNRSYDISFYGFYFHSNAIMYLNHSHSNMTSDFYLPDIGSEPIGIIEDS